jgi:2-polyprenyl-3-methyl-5-hydroxy-6-metoxy-1,4-benzoquinol methylase
MENDFKKIIFKKCLACGEVLHTFFCTKRGHDLYKCSECSMLSLHPVPHQTDDIYGKDYFSGSTEGYGYVDYDEDKEPMRQTFHDYLRKIEGHTGKKGLLLDVGAATGFFMSIAEGAGWKTKGVEISKYAMMLAQKKGLDVIHGTMANIDVASPIFDVITMWDVLEHMPDPITDLKRARDMLDKNGLLVLNTPDSGSVYAKLLGKRWHLIIPPEHIHYFTNESIAKVLDACGFETISISRIGKKFTLEYIFAMLHKWLNWGIFMSSVRFLKKHKKLGQFSIPINLRDNMFVVARKKD